MTICKQIIRKLHAGHYGCSVAAADPTSSSFFLINQKSDFHQLLESQKSEFECRRCLYAKILLFILSLNRAISGVVQAIRREHRLAQQNRQLRRAAVAAMR